MRQFTKNAKGLFSRPLAAFSDVDRDRGGLPPVIEVLDRPLRSEISSGGRAARAPLRAKARLEMCRIMSPPAAPTCADMIE